MEFVNLYQNELVGVAVQSHLFIPNYMVYYDIRLWRFWIVFYELQENALQYH
jgi:hypothetical protein